jgi:pimeloyl-ACP methyl ester carboxylesterase
MNREHRVEIPGGSIYYRTEGTGPVLVLAGGGASNTDTLSGLASELAGDYTVITYDRRGYSRSRLDHPDQPATIADHGADVGRVIADLGVGQAAVFGSSIGALIVLALATAAPATISTLVVHEPPLAQLLAEQDRPAFALEGSSGSDPGATLDSIAASVGVRRKLVGAGSGDRLELNSADLELFVSRDVPAVGAFELELERLDPIAERVIVTGGEAGRDFYPYRCANTLADRLGRPLVELPGNHAGMIQQPVEFAARLKELLRSA